MPETGVGPNHVPNLEYFLPLGSSTNDLQFLLYPGNCADMLWPDQWAPGERRVSEEHIILKLNIHGANSARRCEDTRLN